jgi:predicted choloylglycine hydrolase
MKKVEIFKAKNSFELGGQLGKIYKKNGRTVDYVKINHDVYARQLKIYQKYFPNFLEELEGIAAAGDYDQDKLNYSFIGASVESLMSKPRYMRTSCSIFGFKKGNDLFVGRNYVWLPETEKAFKVYKILNKSAYSYVSVSDMGIYKKRTALADRSYLPIDAINEKGLFVGLTASLNNDWAFGLSSTHIIKLITENCKNVADAIKVFKTVPLNCAKNFFMADAGGNMAVIEHFSGLNVKVLYPKDDLLIKTNHYTDPAFAEKDKILAYRPSNTTYIRYYEALREVNLRRDTFTQNDIPKILNRKGSYLLQNAPTSRSIWTLSLNMTKRKYALYYDLFGKKKSLKLKI